MKLINEGDKLTQRIIGEKALADNQLYRPSIYAFLHKFEGESYLYNNFTKKCWQLEQEQIDLDPAKRYSSEEIADNAFLLQLVKDRFLVAEQTDETKLYENYCKIVRAMTVKKEGYSQYTILPTTACNARCVYCYEEGIKFISMSDEILEQTIKFIKESHNPNKPIHFVWFGGEPLLGMKIIDKLCAALRAEKIDFDSKMISNGSLITEELIKKFKEDWSLKSIQITLDGVEEEYNTRKNYIFNYQSAYWHILSRIKLVNDCGIFLTIRVNVDEQNIDGVMTMLEDVKNFLPNPDMVSFDLAPLFDLQESEGGRFIWERSFEVAEEIIEKGYNIALHSSVSRTRYHYCMADSPYSAITIDPEGKLYSCEHIQEAELLGDVYTGVTNLESVKMLAAVEPAREMCKDCFSLPVCTTFSHCPDIRRDCRYASFKRMERALNKMIKYKKENAELPEDESSDKDC